MGLGSCVPSYTGQLARTVKVEDGDDATAEQTRQRDSSCASHLCQQFKAYARDFQRVHFLVCGVVSVLLLILLVHAHSHTPVTAHRLHASRGRGVRSRSGNRSVVRCSPQSSVPLHVRQPCLLPVSAAGTATEAAGAAQAPAPAPKVARAAWGQAPGQSESHPHFVHGRQPCVQPRVRARKHGQVRSLVQEQARSRVGVVGARDRGSVGPAARVARLRRCGAAVSGCSGGYGVICTTDIHTH